MRENVDTTTRNDAFRKVISPPPQVQRALVDLFEMTEDNNGQARAVANFLLAWWNAEEFGGFDIVDLWKLNLLAAGKIALVIAWLATHHYYPDALGFGGKIEAVRRRWRRQR